MNRASRYVPLAGSQAAGAPGSSIGKEVREPRTERTTPPLQAVYGMAAGHDPQANMMILALATRHRVERPAISMEGGTVIIPMERPAPPPSVLLPLKIS